LAQSRDVENVASAGCRIENGQSVCGCHRDDTDDAAFWEELDSLLIQVACLIERRKLRRTHTTSDLRALGKKALCKPDGI
jgi:hypothetical protein